MVRGQVYVLEFKHGQMQVEQRYSFQMHDGYILYGTLRSYLQENRVPKGRLIIDYYTVNNVFCSGYYSVPSCYMERIWKIIVEFSALPKEINNIIQAYY